MKHMVPGHLSNSMIWQARMSRQVAVRPWRDPSSFTRGRMRP
jgi:hypothetical protein